MTHQFSSASTTLEVSVERLSDWLADRAIPLWMTRGVDDASGGFHERIAQNGVPVASDNRRARVQPRQIYCFATAGTRGFDGPWGAVVKDGLAYFEATFRREDGLFGAVADPAGKLIDDTFDLYNQAFAIFGYSQLAATFPQMRAAMEERATDLIDRIAARYKHPLAGFEETDPPSTPLCSNPHMHLFEATLAWEEVAHEPKRWTALADEIAGLAMTKFIDSKSGGLREFFDHDWNPHPSDKGRIMEPGHQFEWAWLLARWGALRKNQEAIDRAERLFEIGIEHGMAPDGKVAIMGLYDDFSVHDPIARMWPQTEWLKAATRLALVGAPERRSAYLGSAARACEAFDLFLKTPIEGLWYDKRRADGTFIGEPAPASTFYHIACAIYEAADNLTALKSAA
jgi:mannose/cellobiose epimerase-like protein (N-acyl-D-glucosamine 2-epimerase family)